MKFPTETEINGLLSIVDVKVFPEKIRLVRYTLISLVLSA